MTSPTLQDPNIDVLLVGAGFSGVYLLHKLRKLNLSVKVFEAGSNLGGTWYWNCYPGARVDSDYFIYQLSLPELWKDWSYTERFPCRDELVKYFDYINEKLEIKKDVLFETRVKGATFDKAANRWDVSTENGVTARPRYLVLCTGFASKPLMPNIPGLDTFKGIMHHTSLWPQEGLDLEGKRIGVIGTGATGVQVIQECGPKAKQLTVFQRTPNLALPMMQHPITKEGQDKMKKQLYQIYFTRRLQTFAGFQYDLQPSPLLSVLAQSPERLRLDMEDLWSRGGFHYWLAGYPDMFNDEKANEVVYKFWREKVLERVTREEMKELLAPEKAPHPFGIKRPSLEQSYFEVYNQPHVSLIDVSANPITSVTPNGVKTADGKEHELDVLVLATGFDAVTGSISRIDIETAEGTGEKIGEKWKKGLATYLGTTTAGYPNMFFLYGPHGPTAFCNGPTCLEVQADWIVTTINNLRNQDLTLIEPLPSAETSFTEVVNDHFKKGLWLQTNSWYNGGNVPGKKVESLNFTLGLPKYISMLREEVDNGYPGFTLSK